MPKCISLTEAREMRYFRQIESFLRDERGGEVLEYAIVSGLIVVAAIGVIGKIGTKVLARWSSLNSSL
jgi:Flp pilus assembly pilin Flp